MSDKLNYIPFIPNYEYIQNEMEKDLEYRLNFRNRKTKFGRPLYKNISVQIITTHKCPYNCPFCIEKINPIGDSNDNKSKQLMSLIKILQEHKDIRLTITGGEPGLFPIHIRNISNIYKKYSNNVFISINTTGINLYIQQFGHINLSVNKYLPKPNLLIFKNCTYQTVLSDDEMNLENIKNIMDNEKNTNKFSFRFISDIKPKQYNINIFNELQNNSDIKINTFRIGDFFTYCTFDYKNNHGRITLGDMYQQKKNNYKDGYSNIIIHPDGNIGLNWR